MLDAACPGDVFAAPLTDYVYETTKLMLKSPKGVPAPGEQLHRRPDGVRHGSGVPAEAEVIISQRSLFIDDDVAVKDSTYTVGRRGVAGNFFVMKAVGAASEDGADLDEPDPHRRRSTRSRGRWAWR